MAAQAWKVYAKAKKYIGAGTITLGAGVYKMCLLRNSATTLGITALSTRSTWTSIAAAEITAKGGYAQHGRNIGPAAGKWTVGASAKQYKFTYTTSGIVFTASNATLEGIRFAILRNSLSTAGGKLLCYCSLTATAFDVISPNTLTIKPPSAGVFYMA